MTQDQRRSFVGARECLAIYPVPYFSGHTHDAASTWQMWPCANPYLKNMHLRESHAAMMSLLLPIHDPHIQLLGQLVDYASTCIYSLEADPDVVSCGSTFACVGSFHSSDILSHVHTIAITFVKGDLKSTSTVTCPHPHNHSHRILHQQKRHQHQTKHRPNHLSFLRNSPVLTPNSHPHPKWPTATTQATNPAHAPNPAADAAKTSVSDKQPLELTPATASPPNPWLPSAKRTNSS
jgi:hypothetical protein